MLVFPITHISFCLCHATKASVHLYEVSEIEKKNENTNGEGLHWSWGSALNQRVI